MDLIPLNYMHKNGYDGMFLCYVYFNTISKIRERKNGCNSITGYCGTLFFNTII